jgi:ABC-type dipeptide/oligopeptide/nickel transport system permease component
MGFTWFTTFQPADEGLLQGNLGLSMEHEKPAREVIGDRVVLTVFISCATVLLAWVVAIPTGIYSAVRQYSPGDYAVTLLGFLGVSIPSFLLAIVVMYLAKRWLGLNTLGLFSPEFDTMAGWNSAKVIDLVKHV